LVRTELMMEFIGSADGVAALIWLAR